jgi:hypothetical protein
MREQTTDEIEEEATLDRVYREAKATGFISESSLNKKYAVEKTKSLEDIKIPGFENVNQYKIEAVNYILLRLRNMGHDLGYNNWLKDYGIGTIKNNISNVHTKDKTVLSLLSLLGTLLSELEAEMRGAKVEPVFWKSVIQREQNRTPTRVGVSTRLEEEELMVVRIVSYIYGAFIGISIFSVALLFIGIFWKGQDRVVSILGNFLGMFVSLFSNAGNLLYLQFVPTILVLILVYMITRFFTRN